MSLEVARLGLPVNSADSVLSGFMNIVMNHESSLIHSSTTICNFPFMIHKNKIGNFYLTKM